MHPTRAALHSLGLGLPSGRLPGHPGTVPHYDFDWFRVVIIMENETRHLIVNSSIHQHCEQMHNALGDRCTTVSSIHSDGREYPEHPSRSPQDLLTPQAADDGTEHGSEDDVETARTSSSAGERRFLGRRYV
ncbi:X-Linked Retinitis Pigmentosa Gtpase Regulator-Interacting Protein 1 [Manis pentadactyla]|nr:X-Linked Retinitis Pigmentosa Gtpase Regulator-Interacting Protein 1 [Manis pentadactyla]